MLKGRDGRRKLLATNCPHTRELTARKGSLVTRKDSANLVTALGTISIELNCLTQCAQKVKGKLIKSNDKRVITRVGRV